MDVKIKKIWYFIGFTYISTLLFFIGLQIFGGKSNPKTISLIGIPMVFPLIAVVVVRKWMFKENIRETYKVTLKFNYWWLIGIFVPIIIALTINLLSIIQRKSSIFTKEEFIFNIVIGLTIASISALLEEAVWRGFLYRELKFLGFYKMFLLIGIIWALWHTPVTILYKYPNNPLLGVVINFLQMFFISTIITYIRYKSESILAAAITHGMFNTMILSSNMDDFKIVLVKILLCILVMVLLSFKNLYKKKRITDSEKTCDI